MENTSSDFPTVQLETTHRQLFTVQNFLKETSFFVHFPTSIKLVNAILQVHPTLDLHIILFFLQMALQNGRSRGCIPASRMDYIYDDNCVLLAAFPLLL